MSSHVDDDPTASRNVPRLFLLSDYLCTCVSFSPCALSVRLLLESAVKHLIVFDISYKVFRPFLRSMHIGFIPSQASVYLRKRPFSLTTWCCGIPPQRGYWLVEYGWSLIRSCMKTRERNKGLISSTRVWCIDCQRLNGSGSGCLGRCCHSMT